MNDLAAVLDSQKSLKNNVGMSLLELMVVVSIIGILVIMVFPSYQQHILKSRRADCAIQLLRMKMQQESFRLHNVSYATTSELSLPQNDYFDFSVVNVSATTYTLVAQAKGSQQKDSACQTLALDQSMHKTPLLCW
jgi:type IV pilus assembly protein PilE